jgi:Flp pilus assembly protein protease CpaA
MEKVIQIIQLLICLGFLIHFSYKDIKYQEVENEPIILFLIIGIVFTTYNQNIRSLLPFCLFWLILGLILWYSKSIGGADVKILAILPLFCLNDISNKYIASVLFITLFVIFSGIYFIIASLSRKKGYIPLVPVITITFIIYEILVRMLK